MNRDSVFATGVQYSLKEATTGLDSWDTTICVMFTSLFNASCVPFFFNNGM
ncbi:hypothetical protein ACFQO0_00590 [Herminiimonas aquatilis]|uniref:Uncharacterized protein n=1 Tax=Herminiimonas aquatilis TaxID=345342 RepID=A0ABW2J1Q6_9BURK